VNSPFAENQRLPPGSQSFANDGPFLEGDLIDGLHGGSWYRDSTTYLQEYFENFDRVEGRDLRSFVATHDKFMP
jgi:hypothetical protein